MDSVMAIADRLRHLGLEGMAESFISLMNIPIQMRPRLDTAVQQMVEEETRYRNDKRTEKLLRAAKLRNKVYVEDIICSTERNLTNDTMSELSTCSFIRQGQNLLITGKTGCGKSYLACALGTQACILGLRTLYLNLNRFVEAIKQAKLDGTFRKMLNKMEKIDLIILDDFGLQKLDSETRLALLTILDERYDRKSVIICSQLPLDKWYDYIADATLADAIMDRLIHSSHHVMLTGNSMRKQRRKK